MFIGRFVVVGCKFSGGGRGGRTGGTPPTDLGDVPNAGENKYRFGGPWQAFLGGPCESFHEIGLLGYPKSFRSEAAGEEAILLSSTRDDVLLPRGL